MIVLLSQLEKCLNWMAVLALSSASFVACLATGALSWGVGRVLQ